MTWKPHNNPESCWKTARNKGLPPGVSWGVIEQDPNAPDHWRMTSQDGTLVYETLNAGRSWRAAPPDMPLNVEDQL
jgi:hypothetical protein